MAQALTAAQAKADAHAACAADAEQRLADAERRLFAAGPGPHMEPDLALPLVPQPQPQLRQPGSSSKARTVENSMQTEPQRGSLGGENASKNPTNNHSTEGSPVGTLPLLPLAVSAAAGLESAGCCAAGGQGLGPGDAGRASQSPQRGDLGARSCSAGRPPADQEGWRFAPGRLDAPTPAGMGLGLEPDPGAHARCHASPVRLVFAEQAPAERPSSRARPQALSDAEEADFAPRWASAASASGSARRSAAAHAAPAVAHAAAAGAACQSGVHDPDSAPRPEPAGSGGALDARAAGRNGAGPPEQHQARLRHSKTLHPASDASSGEGAASRVGGGSRRRSEGAGAAAHGSGGANKGGFGVASSRDGGAAARRVEDLRRSHSANTAAHGGAETGSCAHDEGSGLESSSGDDVAGSRVRGTQRLRATGAAAQNDGGGSADDQGYGPGFSSGDDGMGVRRVEELLAQAEAAARRSAGRAWSAPNPKPWADTRAGDDDICR